MTPSTPEQLKRYRGYFQDEIDGVYYYETLAKLSEEQALRDLYSKMAETESRHLELWRRELQAGGIDISDERPSRRARTLMWLARRFGTELVLPIIKAHEAGADQTYSAEPVAVAAGLPNDERSHLRLFAALASGPARGVSGSAIGRIESRHRSLGGGNALRAAVLGANDGLVSNFALVMGIAAADPGQGTVVLVGIAGLIAGSLSMALGEWISVTSSREAAEAQLAVEEEEIRLMPEAEREELALIYQAKGLPREQAEELAASIMDDPDTALATLAREELGLVPEDLGSPWTAAIASLLLFAAGATIPLVPFFFGASPVVVLVAAVLSAIGLFLLGAGITLLTGRNPWFSGSRQVVLGLAAAAITFGIGSLVNIVADI